MIFLRNFIIMLITILLTSCSGDSTPIKSHKLSEHDVMQASTNDKVSYVLLVTHQGHTALLDLLTKSKVHMLQHPSASEKISHLSITPEGFYGLTAGGNTVHLWGLNSGSHHASWQMLDDVSALAIANGGRHGLVGMENGHVQYIDLRTGKTLHNFKHDGPITQVAITDNGDTAITASTDSTARVWNLLTGELESILYHNKPIHIISLSPNNDLLMTSDKVADMKIWRLKDGQLLYKIKTPPIEITNASFSPDQKSIAVGGKPQVITLWNIKNNIQEQKWVVPKENFWRPTTILIREINFTDDGNYLISIDSLGYEHYWPVKYRVKDLE